jgi:hypothetical protein
MDSYACSRIFLLFPHLERGTQVSIPHVKCVFDSLLRVVQNMRAIVKTPLSFLLALFLSFGLRVWGARITCMGK